MEGEAPMDILAPAADVGMEEVIEAKVDRPSAEEPAPAQPAPDTEMAIEAKQDIPEPEPEAPPAPEPEPEAPAPEPEASPEAASVPEPEPDAPETEEPEEEAAPKPTPKPASAKKATPKKATPKKATPKPAAPAPAAEGGRAKRERKPVEHFQVAEPKAEEEQVMMEGKGTKLRDIPNVAFKMSKITGKDDLMESFHNVLYRRKGMAATRKKAILDFCGFAFAADHEEKELEARRVSLGKWKLELIHRLMDTLDLPRGSGDKGAKIDRVMEFLATPSAQSDVDLAAKEAAKKEKAKRKREREAAKKEKLAAMKAKEAAKKRKAGAAKGTPSKKSKKEEVEDDSEAEEPSDEEPMSEDESASEEEEAAPQAKPAPKPKATPKPAKATPKKEAAPAEEKEKAQEDPAAKVPAAQLKADVEAIMDKMNDEELGQMTAKTIIQALKEQYKFEVKSRKAEIKEVVHAYADRRLGSGAQAAAAGDA